MLIEVQIRDEVFVVLLSVTQKETACVGVQ